ncbi:hypothetical protein FKM82_015494 [Ascaphus truei]|uniref:histamine N-methyltransferase-like n=1 Tax=Ascaphus truei TaxID=8439 RepID=UPI003F59E261
MSYYLKLLQTNYSFMLAISRRRYNLNLQYFNMGSALRTLLLDENHYMQSFSAFVNRSTENQCTQQFIETRFPEMMLSLGNGKSPINVLSVGSGSGELDLHIISKIQSVRRGRPITNNVVEPNVHQILKYKECIANTPGLDNVSFIWHEKTADEYQCEANEKDAKFDFIHMIQVIYYLDDLPAALTFFRRSLAPNGKLLIVLISGDGGWATLRRKCASYWSLKDICMNKTSWELTSLLDAMDAKYEKHEIPAELDITECFIEGNKNGELLLDFMTETCDFSKVASPDLKTFIMDNLKDPECSTIKNGKVIFKNYVSAIIIEAQ